MSIKYSFVLPTYNRRNLLKGTLSSLLDQNFEKTLYEVVVIDDNSTDGTDKYINFFYKDVYNIIYHKNSKNKGVGWNRNHGIQLANGEIIIQVEDDAKYPKDYLKEIDRFIETLSDKNRGTIIVLPRKTWNFKEGIVPKMVEYRRKSITELTKKGKRNIIGGWIFKKKVALDLGGYKSLIIGEDTELVNRFSSAGYENFALFSIFWRHYEPDTFHKLLKRMYKQGFYYKEYKEILSIKSGIITKLFWIGVLALPIFFILISFYLKFFSILLFILLIVFLTFLNGEFRGTYIEIIKSRYKYLVFFIWFYFLIEIYGIASGRILRSLKEKKNFIY